MAIDKSNQNSAGSSSDTLTRLAARRRVGPPPKRGLPWGKYFHYAYCSFSYIFLLSPMIVVIGASLHGGEYYTAIKFPPDDPSFQWYWKIPKGQIEALGISFGL
ncbi:MAG: hypothetical protein ACI9FD_003138, partial [Gammaproteobacteria bacterium]